jgi:chaperonin cofactor prefoldin
MNNESITLDKLMAYIEDIQRENRKLAEQMNKMKEEIRNLRADMYDEIGKLQGLTYE